MSAPSMSRQIVQRSVRENLKGKLSLPVREIQSESSELPVEFGRFHAGDERTSPWERTRIAQADGALSAERFCLLPEIAKHEGSQAGVTAHIVLHDQKILPQHLLKGFPFVSASRPSNKKSVDGHVSSRLALPAS